MRVVSGIQPSGKLHLGNYFSAVEQLLELQEAHDCFFFVADYHALTTVRDAARLRQMRVDCIRDYLALGIDPNRVAIFFQSDVPAVAELAWILSTVTPAGLLLRGHAYKDKVAKGVSADAGLLTYPVLMAADVLMYSAELVPIGEDQTQHVEMARDIAERFNRCFGTVFRLPEARAVPLVAGIDGKKMSKSYGNAIEIFGSEDEIRAKVMKIKTDSLKPGEAKDPKSCNLFALFRRFADEVERRDVARLYGTGKVSYQRVKERLVELIVARFAEARRRRAECVANAALVEEALKIGRGKAMKEAVAMMEKVRGAVGLDNVIALALNKRKGEERG